MKTIGSLFSGYGGLDLAVEKIFKGKTIWQCEADPNARTILMARFAVPIFHDIRQPDWTTVPRVDVLCGGFPCQDVSSAGLRKGVAEGTRSGLWFEFARAIEGLAPQFVVIENVKGLLSATAKGEHERGVAMQTVLGDLDALGYDAWWKVLSAADVGAPHRRDRVFILGRPRVASDTD